MGGTAPLKLLLIADPAADVADYRRILADGDPIFQLTTAVDPAPLMRGRRFDCVILDGSDKQAIAGHVRKHHPRVGVLMVTGPGPAAAPPGVAILERARLSDAALVEAISAAIHDVSEPPDRKKARTRRRPLHVQLGNEDVYEELVETMNEGVLTLDREGRITYANPRIAELLGVPQDRLQDQTLSRLLSPEQASAVEAAEPRGKYELELRPEGGTARAFLVSQSPLAGPDGGRIGTLMVLSDVSDVRDYQQRLIQSEKLITLGELLASVAHELNNPLCAIMGYSQLLQGKGIDEETQRMLEKVAEAAARCNRIVRGLLSFARRKKPEKTYVGVNGILREVVTMLAYDLTTHSIEVVWELDELLPMTMADFHQLQQVFLNIINNARQALYDARRGGRLTLRTMQKGGRIRIEIEDDGPGISDAIKPKIFDPFFTTKGPGKGTGLGLSISFGILKEHGGRIGARDAPGGGACFEIDLPILRPQTEVVEPRKAGESTRLFPALARRSFLVVDDEAALVDLLHAFLTQQGARVDVASNGALGLQKILKEDYDAVVCDLRMPGLSGDELFKNLEGVKPQIMKRFLFVTGDVLTGETREFLERSGCAHIAKPFYLKEIARHLARIAGGAQMPRPRRPA
jgi:PAS domain S-box-containing protein